MNRDRLERLATYLRHDVPARRFNMTIWASGPLANSCHTAGCAAGWATVLFRKEGLRMLCSYLVPIYRKEEGVRAMAAFLEISPGDAEEIFYPERYPTSCPITPAMVADRIEEILHRSEERR